ncbi:MAG: hypothetical protein M0R46_13905 [Candidatus Muirbacterium halophilum]|nr:hypothetical protein [Candidatus Muirbacterium halophilum]
MKKYTEFIKENKGDGILMVVDVQTEFGDFIPKGFVDQLIEYCKNYHTVYQIWDSNEGQKKPSYTFPNEKLAVVKKFGTKFSDELEETVKKLNEKYPDAKEGDIFEFDDVNSYVVRVKNNHAWFYVPEKMAQLFSSLKGKSVVVVGGAFGECLSDVFVAMESFGIKVKYDKRYIYSAKTNDDQNFIAQKQPNII